MGIPMDPGGSGAFAGRRVAITGASGSLGLALLRAFHGCGATLVALTTRVEPLELTTSDGNPIALGSACNMHNVPRAPGPRSERTDLNYACSHGEPYACGRDLRRARMKLGDG